MYKQPSSVELGQRKMLHHVRKPWNWADFSFNKFNFFERLAFRAKPHRRSASITTYFCLLSFRLKVISACTPAAILFSLPQLFTPHPHPSAPLLDAVAQIDISLLTLMMDYSRVVWPCSATWPHMFSSTHILTVGDEKHGLLKVIYVCLDSTHRSV